MDGHYDRLTDIAWLRLGGWDEDRVRVQRTPSALIERDRSTGRLLGLECWEAGRRLPPELLEARFVAPRHDVAIERQPA